MTKPSLQKYILPRIALGVRVIGRVLYQKHLLDRLDEMHVGPPSPLETKVTNSVGSYEILQRLQQQRECWFEVHAICSEHDVWLRDMFRTRSSPFIDGRLDNVLQVVVSDILLHQGLHWLLICDVDDMLGPAPHGNGQPIDE